MKPQTISVLTCVAFAAILATGLAAQSGQAAQEQKPAEVSLTGCLIQGSAPTVFILDKARKNPQSSTETTQSYLVINQVEDMDLTRFLNHQVRITGAAGPKQPATNRPPAEKDLPTLTATQIVNVADTCSEPGR